MHHVHACIHTYVRTYVRMYIYTYIHTHAHAHVHVHVHVHVHIYMVTMVTVIYRFDCIIIHAACICMYSYARTYVRTYHVLTYIHTYMYTYIHTRTQAHNTYIHTTLLLLSICFFFRLVQMILSRVNAFQILSIYLIAYFMLADMSTFAGEFTHISEPHSSFDTFRWGFLQWIAIFSMSALYTQIGWRCPDCTMYMYISWVNVSLW